MKYNNLESMTKEELIEIIKGIRSKQLRDNKENKNAFNLSEKIFDNIKGMRIEKSRENLILFMLDAGLNVVRKKIIYYGTEDKIDVNFRIIFKEIFSKKDSVIKIIIAHNHPSGDITPSESDVIFTKDLKKACQLMEVKLLDHIIIDLKSKNHYSMAERMYSVIN